MTLQSKNAGLRLANPFYLQRVCPAPPPILPPDSACRWEPNTTRAFRGVVANLTIPWRTAKKRWPRYFVRAECVLLGLTQNVSDPLNGMKLDLWNGKGPGLSGSKRAYSEKSTAGRKLLQGSTPYGVTGQVSTRQTQTAVACCFHHCHRLNIHHPHGKLYPQPKPFVSLILSFSGIRLSHR